MVDVIGPFRLEDLSACLVFGTFYGFWTDDLAALPAGAQDEIWWEVWCSKGQEEAVRNAAQALEARVADNEKWLRFPEDSLWVGAIVVAYNAHWWTSSWAHPHLVRSSHLSFGEHYITCAACTSNLQEFFRTLQQQLRWY